MRFLLVHGYRGTPETPSWFLWLKKELEAEGHEVFLPQMPESEHPKLTAWLSTIEKLLGGNFSDVIFVGHSLGGNAILRALESHKTDEQAAAVFLAGSPSHSFNKEQRPIGEFLDSPYDWPKIRSRARSFFYLYGEDDTVVPVAHGEEFQKHLGGELYRFSGFGHALGPQKFDAVLSLISTVK